jgi:hypothetical protein
MRSYPHSQPYKLVGTKGPQAGLVEQTRPGPKAIARASPARGGTP